MNLSVKQFILGFVAGSLLSGLAVWFFLSSKSEVVSPPPSPEALDLPPTTPPKGEITDKTVERKIVEGPSSTTITFGKDRYSTEVVDLPPIKSREEALADRVIERPHFEENITEFGDMALRFLPDEYVGYIKKFDVNDDGISEQIVGLCSGGNHCPHKIFVVDGDNIIFSTWGSVSTKEVLPSDVGNGFLVKWANREQESQGYAQPLGYMLTRFVYKDGSFVPVEETGFSYTSN